MAGIANGWDTAELLRAVAQMFVGLALPANGAVMVIDPATGTPDATANPNGFSLGYTNEGWEFATSPTFDEIRVDEEEDPTSDFITANETTISGAIRQVRNLERLSFMIPGSDYTAPAGTPTQIEKVTGGGTTTFDYFTAALIWSDPDDDAVHWWVMLYRCLNRGGITMGLGRTKDSAVTVTLTGRALSSRDAGDRVYAIVRRETVA